MPIFYFITIYHNKIKIYFKGVKKIKNNFIIFLGFGHL